jgi:hypothetical protein
MPANRVLVNTPTPQGSTGITTNVFPSMTLGCGAAAGNITSDNVGPQHLYNIKRLAYAVRTPAEAFETPAAAVPKTATEVVDRFLARRGAGGANDRLVSSALPERQTTKGDGPPHASCPACETPAPAPAPAPPKPQIVDFVCEEDVRTAIKQSRKIYIGPKTIVTPSARDLASPSDILVLA